MDGIASLVKPLLNLGLRNDTLKNLLEACADQRAFNKDGAGIASFIGIINANLNASSSRSDGMLLLQTFLPQCPREVLVQNASTWMQFCLKGITAAKTASVSFIVLKMLLKSSVEIPELARHVSAGVVASLADQIHQGIPPEAYLKALECLEECMQNFNLACGPHRKVIDDFIMSMMDYDGANLTKISWQAARCKALMPQIGGGGVGGVKYKSAWASQHNSLCRTIHLILDELYSSVNEIFLKGKMDEIEPLALPPIKDSDPTVQSQKLTVRLFFFQGCLSAMFIEAFPTPKQVAASSVLDLICRGLAVNGSSFSGTKTSHSLSLQANLPKIHYSMLKLLEALILLGRNNMLPAADKICKLVVQTLKWTSVENWPYATERPYSYLRIQAYKILKLWCGTAKLGSLVENVAQQFVELAMCDISSEKETVSLSTGSSSKKKHGNRRGTQHKGSASLPSSSSVSGDCSTSNMKANKEVCVAALQAMQALIMSASFKIQAVLHKILQESVVSILRKIRNRVGESPIPYSDPAPRIELYRLLLQLVLDHHPMWPAPTSIARTLFSSGLHDPDAQISMFCGFAQSSIEKIIHPAYPSLNLIPDPKELEVLSQSCASPSHNIVKSPKNDCCEDIADDSDLDFTDAVSVAAKLKQQRATNLKHNTSSNTASPNEAPVNGRRSNSSDVFYKTAKKSPTSPMKTSSKTNSREVNENTGLKTVDLTLSDKSDDEISEVPCEIDLADSEDDGDKSNHSICSQATVNVPVAETVNPSPAVQEKETSSDVELVLEAPVIREQQPSTSMEVQVEAESTNNIQAESTQGEDAGKERSTSANEVTVSVEKSTDTEIIGSKRGAEEDQQDDPSAKKQKPCDLTFEDDFEEDSMLLAFVDVTRDEEETSG